MSDTTPTNGAERDARGRFIYYPHGGRKPGPTHRTAVKNAVTPEEMAGVVRNLLRFALSDDPTAAVPAARVLLGALAPPPKQINVQSDLHVLKTVRLIADVIQHDPASRDTILALDERVRVACADGSSEPGALRPARDSG